MKKLLMLALILTLSFTANSQTKTVAYTESGFNAAFPTKPIIQKSDLDSKIGKIAVTIYQNEGDDYMIMVSENQYPADAVEKLGATGIKGVFDGAKNGMIKNLEKQLGSKFEKATDEDFLFDGKHTANRSSGSISGIDVSGLCIMKGNHFYIIMAMGNTKAEAVTNFLKSFTLI